MPDLKTVLFEHTRKYYNRYQTFKKLLGEKNEMTIQCENKYYGCDFVIRESGLESEYEMWLKEQENRGEIRARIIVDVVLDSD